MKRTFYLTMMVLITGLILYGFSHTVGQAVIRPAETPPSVLYLHVIVFGGWLVLLMTQTILVWTRNVRLHMRLGWFGLGFGVLMICVGLFTTVVMGHWQVQRDGLMVCMFIYRPLVDIIFFAVAFGLAIHWRKRPELHRRLMLLAAVSVTPPAISRIPGVYPLSFVYFCSDLFILAGIAYDFFTANRIHAVYRWGGAVALAGQLALLTVLSLRPAPFFDLAVAITNAGAVTDQGDDRQSHTAERDGGGGPVEVDQGLNARPEQHHP